MAAPVAHVVVAGTDTGVGKTFVGVALARALVRSGARVVAIKPVESGCGDAPEADEDGARLAAATGQADPPRALLRLRMPVTPALAAEREGVVVDVAALAETVRAAGEGADVVLVEAAGGLLSPLSWTADATDLARALAAGVLLVTSDRLGVLHHVRSTLRALRGAGLRPLGLVLSAPAEPDASTGTNAAALARLVDERGATHPIADRIVSVPRTSHPEIAAEALAPTLRWLRGEHQGQPS
jgi:dethiobiotin synthetase